MATYVFKAMDLAGGKARGEVEAESKQAVSDQLKARGQSWPETAEEEFRRPVREQYERQGNPYYSTARLWDDGIIDPADTRRVLGLGLAAAANAPLEPVSYGIFRM